ncbi:hypothetical protein AAC387_Pa03g0942 [Persea americana]
MMQMQPRSRGRLPQRGRGRNNQSTLDYTQFQQFLEYQRLSQLSTQEGSEAESSDSNPPQKILKLVLIELPSSLPEVTALGMADLKVYKEARQIVHTLLPSLETRPARQSTDSAQLLKQITFATQKPDNTVSRE